MNKNKLIITSLVVAILALVASAETIRYDFGADLTTIDGVSVQEGWMIRLYQDVNNNNGGSWYNSLVLDTSGAVSGINDDIFVGSATGTTVVSLSIYGGLYGPPTSGVTFQGTDSDTVGVGRYYGILFDSDAISTASNFVVLDQSTTAVFSGDGTIGQAASYAIGSTGFGTWQAVPEPATFLLFAMGGFGAWLIRRKQQDK